MSAPTTPTPTDELFVGTKCRVMYNFRGPNKDSIQLKIDDIVKIVSICTQVDGWCYVVTNNDEQERVPIAILTRLNRKPVDAPAYEWFHGRISRDASESRLAGTKNGAFLIRESIHYPGDYSISLSYQGGVQHYRIVCTATNMVTIDNDVFFTDLERLVDHYMMKDMGLVTPLKFACGYKGQKKPAISKLHFAREGWLLAIEELIKEDTVIGKGEFAYVQKGYYRKRSVAIKSMKASNLATEILLHEASITTHLSHKNLVELIGIAADKDSIYMVNELMNKGSLVEYLRSRGRSVITTENQLKFSMDICEGMCYISDNQFVHRDLAARNVLLSENETAKISDFGLTIHLKNPVSLSTRKIAVKWMAPESVKSQVFTIQSDVWSYGIVLWEIFSFGRIPYPRVSKDKVIDHIEDGYRMECPEGCPEYIYNLMKLCWNNNPEDRPTFSKIREDMKKFLAIATGVAPERKISSNEKPKISPKIPPKIPSKGSLSYV